MRTPLLLMALVLAGCDDPTALRPAPSMRELRVAAILDPERDTLAVLVNPGAFGGAFAGATAVLRWPGGESSASVGEDVPWPGTPGSWDERKPCHQVFGGLVDAPRCIAIAVTMTPGVTYELEISSPSHDTARATSTIPGAFDIVSHAQTGTLPGTVEISAVWRSSIGVYRYLVTVQGDQDRSDGDSCSPDFMCYERWFMTTTDTTFSGRIDAKFFEETDGPYRLTIYAMNIDAYGYIFSGADSRFFPVPPRQNVIGGYGAMGAWVIRSVPLTGGS